MSTPTADSDAPPPTTINVIRPLPPHRRFRLIDMMILIAATAVGFALLRVAYGSFEEHSLPVFIGKPPSPPEDSLQNRAIWLIHSCTVCIFHVEPFLVAWSIALILIRLMNPRPRRRRLGIQPGFVAANAATFAIGLAALLIGSLTLLGIWSRDDVARRFDTELIMVGGPIMAGTAVSASWMTLIAARLWRAEPHWIDRLGRMIGLFWIGALLIALLEILLLTYP